MPSPDITLLILGVFTLVYLGMAVGRVPGLQVDRTGIAVIGAIVLVGAGAVSGPQALQAIDFPALLVLAGLMILSAQVGEAGLYDWCAARMAASPLPPPLLLGLVVMVGGGLSALVTNDVVVFAMTPMLCAGVLRRGLDPRPFVLALALAANAGSAATPIGNPQNILIAQAGALDFWGFVAVCGPVAVLSLLLVWGVMVWQWRGRWLMVPAISPSPSGPPSPPEVRVERGAALKAGLAGLLLLALLSTALPQVVSVLLVAGVLLISRRLASRRTLLLVDWPLLVLFAALFIITQALTLTGLPGQAVAALQGMGIMLTDLGPLTLLAVLGSNTIGNVPADMLILTLVPQAGERFLLGLALLSTLAGNLLLTGSMANIIAAEAAAQAGVKIGFGLHARSGVPVTLLTLGVALLGLMMVSGG